MTIHLGVNIHPTVLVYEGATIGAGSCIQDWMHISSGDVIGDGCSFGQNVLMGNEVLS